MIIYMYLGFYHTTRTYDTLQVDMKKNKKKKNFKNILNEFILN